MYIFAFALTVSFAIQRYLSAFAPSNFIVRNVRSAPPTLGLAAALVLSSLVLVALAAALSQWARAGAPGWCHLVALVLAWDALKFSAHAVHTSLRCVPFGGRLVFSRRS